MQEPFPIFYPEHCTLVDVVTGEVHLTETGMRMLDEALNRGLPVEDLGNPYEIQLLCFHLFSIRRRLLDAQWENPAPPSLGLRYMEKAEMLAAAYLDEIILGDPEKADGFREELERVKRAAEKLGFTGSTVRKNTEEELAFMRYRDALSGTEENSA